VSSSTSLSETVVAGVVGRAHGLQGAFYVSGPRAELLVPGASVTVGDAVFEIAHRAGIEDRPILRFAGVEDRAAAEALRGLELRVPRPPLEEDEYWAEDLEGCTVRDGEREVGVVEALLAYPSCDLLEVRRADEPDADPLLVPLVRDAVRSVDVDARVVDIDLAFLGEV
jgi:16S rRNA processing protein RimM